MNGVGQEDEYVYRERLVAAKANELAEHFDSVRIFVTFRPSAETTSEYSHGCGNFCAQFGQVAGWLERQREFIRNDARREDNEE